MPSSGEPLESYKCEQIANLKRKQLQSLCKKNGIRANSKNTVLVEALQIKLIEIQKSLQFKISNNGTNKENASKESNRSKSASRKKKISRRRRRSRRLSAHSISASPEISVESIENAQQNEDKNQEDSHQNEDEDSSIQQQHETVEQNVETQLQINDDNISSPQQQQEQEINTNPECINNDLSHSSSVEAMDVDTSQHQTQNQEQMICDRESGDDEYDTNGNNGSFVDCVDCVDDNEPEQCTPTNPSIKKLDVSNMTSSSNEEEEDQLETCSVSVSYVEQHSNVNNGSLISGGDSLQNTIIVSNDVDEANQSDIEDMMPKSLSLEATPKLNESTETFIRNSLNPQSAQKSVLQIEFEGSKSPTIEPCDDVDMETTPVTDLNKIASLHDEIVTNPIDDEPVNNNMNTSMLSMNASRISVQSASQSPEKACSSSPEWKNTPLKALQILDSYTERLSVEPSTNSVSDKDEKMSEDMDEEKEEIMQNKEDKKVPKQKESPKAFFVENLFFKTPVKVPENYVIPKTEVEDGDCSKNISITFSDGQKFAFKSAKKAVKSAKKADSVSVAAAATVDTTKNKKKFGFRKRSHSLQPKSSVMTPEALCEKTTAIKRMMQEVELNYDKETMSSKNKNGDTKKNVTKSQKKFKAKAAPDWNKIHNKQIFSRQPDLSEWNKQKTERTKKKFACLNNSKMSTPGLKKRSKSMMNGNTHNSEKKIDRKKAIQMVPSSNDHKFNSGADSKLNRKVLRKATPFKKDFMQSGRSQKKKASVKPVFGAITEVTEIASIEEKKCENKKEVPKKKLKLAFDPNKVTSRLFQSTSSSNNKMRKVNDKKIKKRAETPQVRSSMNKMKKMTKSKNWTNIKSKINTGRRVVKSDGEDSDKLKRNCGVKRRLDWCKEFDQEKNGRSASQPPSKKRRMSVQTKERRWQ